MKLIQRNYYLNVLLAVKDIPDIKVITGVRRSGKSKLMDALINNIAQEESANIVRIKLNLKKNETLLDGDKLYAYIEQQYDAEKNNYLFIDEVQMCDGFERVINSIYEEELYDIYLTGSNAFLLSSDLATLFGGRVFEVKLYPFSFNEYLKYFPSNDVDDAFDDYVKKGGMAGSYLYKTEEDARKYVNGIYRTTITKDIVTKFKIENEDLLVMIGNFLMDNVGNQTSIRNVAKKLTSGTYKTNDKTVGAYIDYLCRSFLFYPIQRYDIKGKKYLESDKKYYLSDLSFRFAELGTKDADYGHLYENIVALELLRRGYEVYVGKLYEKEVDFVAIKEGEKLYIQVSDDISREETYKRELSPLMSIKDAYPKMIIARTKHDEIQHEGIRIIDIARWLSASQK
ncbi:ATP-binding protein [Butyrivibrio sp. WCE2006]|uniref:ATP-binding protein n=1 Tax=Butyrivibrio sp. WCE2006 TaxID=1410611 RepID=UPI0005D28DC3|nr:ATP-binding protein [Butyrivibrio sp. WCE2006]